MKRLQIIYNLTALALVLVSANLNIKSQEIQILTAEKPFILKNADATENKTIEPSAVEPIGNGKYLLAADDETDKATNTNLAIVEVSSGKVVNRLQIPCTPENSNLCIPKNPKWEAMAKDANGYFYIIGSHAVKSDDTDTGQKLTDKFFPRSHLFRFRLRDETAQGTEIKIDEKSVIEINVRDFFKEKGLYKSESPKSSQLKIEGLTVRQTGNSKELIFGLREPSDFVWVYAGELPAMPKNGEILSLKPLFKFDAGKVGNIPFQLSSLEYVPNWRGFLVLTSTEEKATNAFFGNRLWFVSDETVKNSEPAAASESLKPLILRNIWEFASDKTEGKKAMKAEGISVLGECSLNFDKKTIRVVIVYDNDGVKDLPGLMQFVELSNKSKM